MRRVPTRSRWRVARIVTGAGSVAVAVGLNHHALGVAIGRLAHLCPAWLPLALAAEIVSYVAMAELQRHLLLAGGVRLRHRSVIALAWASDAVSASMPVGAPLSAAYTLRHFTRRGATPGVAGWAMAASGLMSTAALVAVGVLGAQLRHPVVSFVPLELALSTGLLIGVGGTAVAVLATVSGQPARLEAVARRIRGALSAARRIVQRRRPSTSTAGRDFAGAIVVGRVAGTVAFGLAVANWLADSAALAVSLIAVGAPLPLSSLLFAYTVSQAAANVPVLPGALGITEASLVLALICAGLHPTDALAAALTYRIITYWVQLPVGWAAWIGLRHRSADLSTPTA